MRAGGDDEGDVCCVSPSPPAEPASLLSEVAEEEREQDATIIRRAFILGCRALIFSGAFHQLELTFLCLTH